MKDYSFSETTVNGITHYYTTFVDGDGKEQTVEVNKEVYDTLNQSQQRACSQTRKDRRYGLCSFDESIGEADIIDDSAQTEELLKNVWEHINELTEVQQRRIRLYYFEKKTLAEIGKMEGAAPKNILKSITSALEFLRSKNYF
jgi:RNA polymerase sigma factor (sigma-70 family)